VTAERINRYKKQFTLKFSSASVEEGFREQQLQRGRSSGAFALYALAAVNLCLALLEHWVLAIDSMLPLVGFAILALASLGLALFSTTSHSKLLLHTRVLLPGALTFAVIIADIVLQQYRVYHAFEFALLLIWFGTLNFLAFRTAVLASLGAVVVFSGLVFAFETSEIKLVGMLLVQAIAMILVVLLSYILERMRRMVFLVSHAMQDATDRQESWAYTLIDLDMALSGIKDFDEMIRRLMEYLPTTIRYDSYILTSLKGKGPKPEADVIEGTLFEQEDQTLWPENLLTKLSQTRQADTSSVFDTSRGFMGREHQKFKHFRMDIPIFDDSSMVAVISLRREDEAFDDLDSTAGVSLVTQAMMIFKRSSMADQMSETIIQKASELARKHQAEHEKRLAEEAAATREIRPIKQAPAQDMTESSPTAFDMEITGTESTDRAGILAKSDGRETVMPKEVVRIMQERSKSSGRTITLLSRENADKIAVDRYRTAAVEGEPLSILLFEVDGLSSIREQDGDQTAYKVFAGIVKYIFSRVNPERDVLGRYGQNGLSVLLINVDMNAAEKFAEGIRKHIEQARYKTPYGERTATVSIGVAAITDETGNYESMVKRADMALFVAKKNGRNCVKVRL